MVKNTKGGSGHKSMARKFAGGGGRAEHGGGGCEQDGAHRLPRHRHREPGLGPRPVVHRGRQC